MMKKTNLFDPQHPERDPQQKNMLQDAEGRCTDAMDDDDLSQVNAAGDYILVPVIHCTPTKTNSAEPILPDPLAMEAFTNPLEDLLEDSLS